MQWRRSRQRHARKMERGRIHAHAAPCCDRSIPFRYSESNTRWNGVWVVWTSSFCANMRMVS